MSWIKLGEGTYNTAYRNEESTEVLKIQKKTDSLAPIDTPERSVRLWELINPGLPARVEITPKGRGWVCPFIDGRQSTPEEISKALIEIYSATGRIVLDAISEKNFMTDKTGRVICVDIAMAVQLEAQDGEVIKGPKGLRRQKSAVSLMAWRELYYGYVSYFNTNMQKYGLAIKTVKALFFIKVNRPDVEELAFLIGNTDLIDMLFNAYECGTQAVEIIKKALALFDKASGNPLIDEAEPVRDDPTIPQAKPVLRAPSEALVRPDDTDGDDLLREWEVVTNPSFDLEALKTGCAAQLNAYIHSLGELKTDGEIALKFTSTLFKNVSLCKLRVKKVCELLKLIRASRSAEEILGHLTCADKADEFARDTGCHGIGRHLQICLREAEVGAQVEVGYTLVSATPSCSKG